MITRLRSIQHFLFALGIVALAVPCLGSTYLPGPAPVACAKAKGPLDSAYHHDTIYIAAGQSVSFRAKGDGDPWSYDNDYKYDPELAPDTIATRWYVQKDGGSWTSIGSSETISYTFTDAGAYTVKLEVNDTPGRNNDNTVVTDTIDVKAISAEVKSVIFSSDHNMLRKYVPATNSGDLFTPRGWTKSPAVSNPISQTMNTSLVASVIICVKPTGVTYTLDSTVSNFCALALGASSTTLTGSDQTLTATGYVALPDCVCIGNDSTVWTVGNITGASSSLVIGAGTSGPHKVYVTYSTPAVANLYDLALDKGCGYADNKSTAGDVASACNTGVHGDITYNPGVNNHDDLRLYAEGEGQCCNCANLLLLIINSLGESGELLWSWGGCSNTLWDMYRSTTTDCSFRCTASGNPHFTFHCQTKLGGVIYDPSYGTIGGITLTCTLPAHTVGGVPYPAATLRTGSSLPTTLHDYRGIYNCGH